MSTCAGTVIVRASIAAATAISSRAPDYGIVTLALDGYWPGIAGRTVEIAPVPLGSATALTAGPHTPAISVTGRNPASSGSFAGVDYPDLAPA